MTRYEDQLTGNTTKRTIDGIEMCYISPRHWVSADGRLHAVWSYNNADWEAIYLDEGKQFKIWDCHGFTMHAVVEAVNIWLAGIRRNEQVK